MRPVTDASWIVGIDIGGTFTDVVAVDTASGEVRTAKVRSRPRDPVESVSAAFEAVGTAWSGVTDLVHGTTMATNAIVEGNLARVALVATEGFGDTLAIGRQNRRELYRLEVPPKLPPLVPAKYRLEVAERVDAAGTVLTALEPAEIERIAAVIGALGAEAVAISLLHSYAHPAHEARLGERLGGLVPYVALSHRINPEPREFERTNSAVLNAALMPLAAGYLQRLEARAGTGTRVHLFHSAGGMTSVESVKERPLGLALSGPAAGVAAAARVADAVGLPAVIGFDMGGTTTDASIVLEGRVQIDSNQRLAGRPVRQLMVAVESIGAGGGSIARLDGRAIRVGPDSAGADPGPACYGLGGEQPTVTDANLVLGYLNADRLLGGSVRLDAALAEAAVGPIAEAFGVPVPEAAMGIHRVANASMARALRRVTVERGVDARRCALLAFGGAGPMHAVALAREFGISKILVPAFSSVFSALGCLTAERSYAEQHAVNMPSTAWDATRLSALHEDMYARLSAPVLAAGVERDRLEVRRLALIRYAGQSDTVEVPFAPPADPDLLGADFAAAHERIYGFATDEEWELDSLRITVTGPPAQAIETLPVPVPAGTPAPIATARCWFEAAGPVDTPRYERGALAPEHTVEGPAVIEDAWSTVVVHPGCGARADGHGHLHIEVGDMP
jgi:N-methylhydantoinase A